MCRVIHSQPLITSSVPGSWPVWTLSKGFLLYFQVGQELKGIGGDQKKRKSKVHLPPTQSPQLLHPRQKVTTPAKWSSLSHFLLDSVNCSLLLPHTHKSKNSQLLIASGYCLILVVFIQPIQTFINKFFIQFFSSLPV